MSIQILVVDASILASSLAGHIADMGDRFVWFDGEREDGSVMKDHGARIVLVDAPDDFSPSRYSYVDGELVANPPPPPVPVVPDSVDAADARLALLAAGLLDEVESALAAMEGDEGRAARIEWEFRPRIFRHNVLVTSLARALGWSDEQVDALFITAGGG